MDADLQHDENVLPQMIEKVRTGADVAIGSRYSSGASVSNWDKRRVALSQLATKASRLVLKQDIADPMSGFFVLRRDIFEDCARNLSGIGFKILLDILASSPRTLRIAEVPYTFRARAAGESKLDEMVIWEYGMLLADKTLGRYIPVRFIVFSFIGGLGVFVHMAVLTSALKGLGIGFTAAQSIATSLAMIFNYALNNALTYRDRRLKGVAWIRGLLTFIAACSIGAMANVGVSTYLFENRTQWALAALAGVMVGAVWNYAVTQIYTWAKH
jgi:dolichol-phosphate mannosyltransferase